MPPINKEQLLANTIRLQYRLNLTWTELLYIRQILLYDGDTPQISIKDLATKLHRTGRQVQIVLARLEEKEILSRTAQFSIHTKGQQLPNRFSLAPLMQLIAEVEHE